MFSIIGLFWGIKTVVNRIKFTVHFYSFHYTCYCFVPKAFLHPDPVRPIWDPTFVTLLLRPHLSRFFLNTGAKIMWIYYKFVDLGSNYCILAILIFFYIPPRSWKLAYSRPRARRGITNNIHKLIELSIHKPCSDNCVGLRIELVTIEKHVEKVTHAWWVGVQIQTRGNNATILWVQSLIPIY